MSRPVPQPSFNLLCLTEHHHLAYIFSIFEFYIPFGGLLPILFGAISSHRLLTTSPARGGGAARRASEGTGDTCRQCVSEVRWSHSVRIHVIVINGWKFSEKC